MKNKKFLYKGLAVVFFTGLSFTNMGCSDSYLDDVQNSGAFNTDLYFQNEQQSFSALVSVYDVLRKYSGGFENTVTFFNAGSDDFYSGGGSSSDGAGIQGINNYMINPNTMPASYWKDFYQGVARANLVIERVPGASMSDDLKKRYIGEAKVLRSLYYFELVRMFGNIPVILKTFNSNDDYWHIPQADPSKVYAQIESDITAAIPDLMMTASGNDKGRITQGTARAILGKIYLYDRKMPEAAAQFAEVNGTPGGTSQYGYKLVANYADLFKVGPETSDPYKFSTESILEVMHTNKGNSDWGFWGQGKDEGNSINVMVCPRSYSLKNIPNNDAPDIFSGWAFNTVTDDYVNFMQGDPRLNVTVFNAKQLVTDGKISYSPAFADTGYFLNKYLPTNALKSSLPGPAELNFRQNYVAIRLADTYLMEAEALGAAGGRAQALLDAVRARVGLASVPVSLQAVKDERRRELAGEGHRWFDLVRWGDAPSKLAFKGFKANKNEILPIPFNELPNTSLKQNPGY
ncbi:RagB/SusD family nutrient uptake outer membrane protein [Chryseobacterium lactis]|uniref:RagB/SusD family nutrient uptake outer membrane protein n=1 Tax=Chryseobacterium lactis TaxID=1241981 RepID=A0A3G6RPD4_CHRLC|nr:RagB/SusD family nutrient uptake outer membrane protein [Chryseobacterium lactis]AZA83361.1 RagB/SusD family nutrient uptake outer membrane protein [Chryseobacterium lactis]AZB03746.1 RagB/SusD family nutrient uptake outer membrane protein [Chryseobacterium lactis]PNW11678.1 RagB/SusD family nutrient uptake outer membrane protein [Chryseobacterium lactis]